MSTSVYAVTEPVMEKEARVWPWTRTTVHRNPLACTRSESSLKKTGRHVQEDGKTATQEDGNAGTQHGAKHQGCQGAVACVRSTRQVVDHEKHEEHEEHETHETHEGHGGGSREARKLHRLLARVCFGTADGGSGRRLCTCIWPTPTRWCSLNLVARRSSPDVDVAVDDVVPGESPRTWTMLHKYAYMYRPD